MGPGCHTEAELCGVCGLPGATLIPQGKNTVPHLSPPPSLFIILQPAAGGTPMGSLALFLGLGTQA